MKRLDTIQKEGEYIHIIHAIKSLLFKPSGQAELAGRQALCILHCSVQLRTELMRNLRHQYVKF